MRSRFSSKLNYTALPPFLFTYCLASFRVRGAKVVAASTVGVGTAGTAAAATVTTPAATMTTTRTRKTRAAR